MMATRARRAAATTNASDYARLLLRSLDHDAAALPPTPATPAEDWAHSGLVPLTGLADGPPQVGPGVLPTCANGALLALSTLAGEDVLPGYAGSNLLSDRAAMLGLNRRGRTSANGTCRLLAARDGFIGLSLARDEDRGLLPAWLEADGPAAADAAGAAHAADAASHIDGLVATSAMAPLVARGRLLGLPVAGLGDTESERWLTVERHRSAAAPPGAHRRPLIVDLSSLWAGPLCTHLLARCGARVIKVESASRPDAARDGASGFFDLLHAGKESVVLDLPQPAAVRQLLGLIGAADIVVESSRPRALLQMGVDAAACVRQRPALTWLSITGYGRAPATAMHVAFGDDAAVAAGLVGAGPVFCGDAICDPLTGLHAALAAYGAWRHGGGVVVDVALAGVGAFCLRYDRCQYDYADVAAAAPIAPPRARPCPRPAAAFGFDTARVLGELAC